MITRLTLENFKSYNSETFELAPLTLLVGTNASGKSNIRDALRLLHAVGRGYSLGECLNGSWGESGSRVWEGIRGGAEEVCRRGRLTVGRPHYPQRPRNWPTDGASIEATLSDEQRCTSTYRITIGSNGGLRLLGERLTDDCLPRPAFDTHPESRKLDSNRAGVIWAARYSEKQGLDPQTGLSNTRPIITQLPELPDASVKLRESLERLRVQLAGMRFLDLIPDRMRDYARPEVAILGDHGENLSAVLNNLVSSKSRKSRKNLDELLLWLEELTPTDIEDLDFYHSDTGEVLLKITEPNGKEISARSASDGTLRYLALAAALLSAKPGQTFFIEEIENGVHPTRLHLLVQMLEQMTGPGRAQVVASTHSPLAVAYLRPSTLQAALYCYRDEQLGLSHFKRVVDFPGIEEVMKLESVDRLLTSGWMEHQV